MIWQLNEFYFVVVVVPKSGAVTNDFTNFSRKQKQKVWKREKELSLSSHVSKMRLHNAMILMIRSESQSNRVGFNVRSNAQFNQVELQNKNRLSDDYFYFVFFFFVHSFFRLQEMHRSGLGEINNFIDITNREFEQEKK